MSMFYELMMRKKTEIMYATIKGSLTENDGVFSGFSESNYLNIMQSVSLGNSFEIVTKITTGTIGTSQEVIISGKTNQYFNVSIQNGKTQQNIGNGRAWIINDANKTVGTTYIQSNTTYLVKFSYDGTTFRTHLSTDNGATWILDWSYNYSLTIPSCQIVFGVSRTLGSVWGGSIDLNNSYIKLGATKYKLQAVVGYTVVGSPTISDGVVSGFSVDDYLTLPNFTYDTTDDFEWNIKFTTGGTIETSWLLAIDAVGGTMRGIYYYSNGAVYIPLTPSVTIAFSGIIVRSNTIYTINLRKTGNNIVGQLKDINGNLLKESSVISDSITIQSSLVRIGRAFSGYFNGSVDLKETYIKINNKLWFNGQQA